MILRTKQASRKIIGALILTQQNTEAEVWVCLPMYKQFPESQWLLDMGNAEILFWIMVKKEDFAKPNDTEAFSMEDQHKIPFSIMLWHLLLLSLFKNIKQSTCFIFCCISFADQSRPISSGRRLGKWWETVPYFRTGKTSKEQGLEFFDPCVSGFKSLDVKWICF